MAEHAADLSAEIVLLVLDRVEVDGAVRNAERA